MIGWVDGPSFSHPEQATSISLEVNYLKGSGASVTDFDVAVSGMDQTAGKENTCMAYSADIVSEHVYACTHTQIIHV